MSVQIIAMIVVVSMASELPVCSIIVHFRLVLLIHFKRFQIFLRQGYKLHFLLVLLVNDLQVPHSAAPTRAQLAIQRHALAKGHQTLGDELFRRKAVSVAFQGLKRLSHWLLHLSSTFDIGLHRGTVVRVLWVRELLRKISMTTIVQEKQARLERAVFKIMKQVFQRIIIAFLHEFI